MLKRKLMLKTPGKKVMVKKFPLKISAFILGKTVI
jgi:hypothetical protein